MSKVHVCEEHIDLALEKMIDETELPPEFQKIDKDSLSTACEYCQNKAEYVVGN